VTPPPPVMKTRIAKVQSEPIRTRSGLVTRNPSLMIVRFPMPPRNRGRNRERIQSPVPRGNAQTNRSRNPLASARIHHIAFDTRLRMPFPTPPEFVVAIEHRQTPEPRSESAIGRDDRNR